MNERAELVVDGLRIDVASGNGRMRAEWTGRSTDAHPERFLAPFLGGVAERALASGAVLELHFELLEYFNSSTINALIQFFRWARSHQLPVEVSFRGDARWQSISFEALRVFERPDGLLSFHSVVGAR
jgi:hypothetical protein